MARLDFQPLTPERWGDFERLFRERRGVLPDWENLAGGGCWCMEFRRPPREWLAESGEGNRRAMQALVESGEATGILAYEDGEAVGWCSISPRAQCVGLESREHLRPVDAEPVWSIVCFFVAREARGRGVMRGLLEAALAFARERSARIVEAYPVANEPTGDLASGFRGVVPVLERAGFREVACRFPGEPILRRRLADG